MKTMLKALITWAFDKYVWEPAQRERMEHQQDMPTECVIEFEASPELSAQIEKKLFKPESH